MKQYNHKTTNPRYLSRATYLRRKKIPSLQTLQKQSHFIRKQNRCVNVFNNLIKQLDYDELFDLQTILSSMLCNNKIYVDNSSNFSENVKYLIKFINQNLCKNHSPLFFLEQCLHHVNLYILQKNNEYVNENIGIDKSHKIYEKFINSNK